MAPIAGLSRKADVFRILEHTILPRIRKLKRAGDPIRIWIPGASTGEEVYSIAACLLKAAGRPPLLFPIQIFGTDLAEEAIRRARAGAYPESAPPKVSPGLLGRFFIKEHGQYRIAGDIRDACVFARHDVTSDPPFSRLDLIFCREALADLEPALQRSVLANFHYGLRDSGFLWLETAEPLNGLAELFTILDPRNRIFTKKAGISLAAAAGPALASPGTRRRSLSVAGIAPALSVLDKNDAADTEVRQLKDELARSRERLRTVILQTQITNEEFQTPNEEAMSSMEELQSANEELESAREQLQASNEELVVMNEEVRKRNLELAGLNDDLMNILSGTNIAIVMLGDDRRIRRATPNAEKLFHVLSADMGRRITDIRMGFPIEDLDGLISTVLRERRQLDREVWGEDGRWYSLRVRPYWTAAKEVDGVLLTLVDIHAIKEGQEAARKQERFVSAILDAAGWTLLVIVLDPDGKIVHFNRACHVLTGYSLEEVRARRPWDFLLAPQESGGFTAVFQHLTANSTQELQQHWVTKNGRHRLIALYITVTAGEDGRVQYVIGSGIDVTERQQAREQARQSEATVRALLETAAQAIIGINAAGSVVLANAAAEAIFGYTREEMLDHPLERLVPRRLLQQHLRGRSAFFERPPDWRTGRRMDVAGLRKDGTEFPAEISLSHVATGDGNLAVAFITDITERKRNEEVLRRSEAAARASQQQLRELTAGVLEAQEEERRRVSRELHDDLNQKLAMLAVEIGGIESNLPQSDRTVRSQLQCVEKRLNSLSDDVRRTAYQLHPSVLEHLGLADALETYCSEFAAQEGIKVDFRLRRVPGTIAKGVALCLYRVAQEALRNIARHSGAPRAFVILGGAGGGLTLTVEDQGRGFDPSVVEGKRGLGLISMKERVTAVGGRLTIEARPGAGTRVRVQIRQAGGSQ